MLMMAMMVLRQVLGETESFLLCFAKAPAPIAYSTQTYNLLRRYSVEPTMYGIGANAHFLAPN